jgi:hypothetical protein
MPAMPADERGREGEGGEREIFGLGVMRCRYFVVVPRCQTRPPAEKNKHTHSSSSSSSSKQREEKVDNEKTKRYGTGHRGELRHLLRRHLRAHRRHAKLRFAEGSTIMARINSVLREQVHS